MCIPNKTPGSYLFVCFVSLKSWFEEWTKTREAEARRYGWTSMRENAYAYGTGERDGGVGGVGGPMTGSTKKKKQRRRHRSHRSGNASATKAARQHAKHQPWTDKCSAQDLSQLRNLSDAKYA